MSHWITASRASSHSRVMLTHPDGVCPIYESSPPFRYSSTPSSLAWVTISAGVRGNWQKPPHRDMPRLWLVSGRSRNRKPLCLAGCQRGMKQPHPTCPEMNPKPRCRCHHRCRLWMCSIHMAQCSWWTLAEHPAGNANAALGYHDVAINTLNISNYFHTDKVALLTTHAWVGTTRATGAIRAAGGP